MANKNKTYTDENNNVLQVRRFAHNIKAGTTLGRVVTNTAGAGFSIRVLQKGDRASYNTTIRYFSGNDPLTPTIPMAQRGGGEKQVSPHGRIETRAGNHLNVTVGAEVGAGTGWVAVWGEYVFVNVV